jgi:hypothetical protein
MHGKGPRRGFRFCTLQNAAAPPVVGMLNLKSIVFEIAILPPQSRKFASACSQCAIQESGGYKTPQLEPLPVGLKANEALQLVMTDEDKRRHNIKNRRTVARFIAKYLRDKKLPFMLKSFHRDDMGDLFIIRHPPKRH